MDGLNSIDEERGVGVGAGAGGTGMVGNNNNNVNRSPPTPSPTSTPDDIPTSTLPPVTSVVQHPLSSNNDNNNNISQQHHHQQQATTTAPGAYSVNSRPVGELPAWRHRLHQRLRSVSYFGGFGGGSGRASRRRSRRSRNGGGSGNQGQQQQESSTTTTATQQQSQSQQQPSERAVRRTSDGLPSRPSSRPSGTPNNEDPSSNNRPPADSNIEDPTAIPPELRPYQSGGYQSIRRFFIRTSTNNSRRSRRSNASSSDGTTRSRRFSMSRMIFGGDAVVEPRRQEEAQQAQIPQNQDLDETTYKRSLWIVICISLIVIAIVVGVVVGVSTGDNDNNSNKSKDSSDDEKPTLSPTNQPTIFKPSDGESQRLKAIRDIVTSISVITEDDNSFSSNVDNKNSVLFDPSTPQYEALLWISEDDDNANLDLSKDAERIKTRYVLATLYYSTDGKRWYDQYEFISEKHECDWASSSNSIAATINREGISCNDQRQVVSIYLDSNNLAGTVPLELRGLSNLQYLTIANNTFEVSLGGEKDEFDPLLDAVDSINNILYLSNLRVLDISRNLLDSTIPTTIGRLSDLEILNLEYNQFKFIIPTEFSLLTNLKELTLGSNRLFGNIESTLENLPHLEILSLEFNDFMITPDLNFPISLKELSLDGNRLTTQSSPLTTNIGRLSNLQHLNLNRMGITGRLPPEGIGRMTALESLHLGRNEITGQFPWDVMVATRSTLRDLFLVQCSFTGQLPTDIGRFTALTSLGLIRNSLTGTIPESFGDLTNLFAFNIRDNEFIGSLPTTIGQLTTLFQFDVSDNNLTGSLPSEMSDMVSLAIINIQGNNFTSGSIDFACSQPDNHLKIDCSPRFIECDCCEC